MWRKRSPIVACLQILPRNSLRSLWNPRNSPAWISRGTLFTLCVLSQQVPRSYQNEELKRQFGVHGIPVEAVLDNGPPIQKQQISRICETARFPAYAKVKGEPKRVIQTVKNLWQKNKEDKNQALLDYRTTPLPGIELPPTQWLMGRRLRNDLPMIDSLFQPTSVTQKDVSMYLKKTKKDQKKHHDRHASSKVKELQPRTKVWMQPWTDSRGWKPETVVRHHHTTGSYLIKVENRRKNRRNRHSYKFAHLQDMKFKCRTVSC